MCSLHELNPTLCSSFFFYFFCALVSENSITCTKTGIFTTNSALLFTRLVSVHIMLYNFQLVLCLTTCIEHEALYIEKSLPLDWGVGE